MGPVLVVVAMLAGVAAMIAATGLLNKTSHDERVEPTRHELEAEDWPD